ncbi:hypothetical protein E1218_16000 [Kribbella turkmenica]|uniref:Uncharacterized protein n=1 Tax=Kribbella turkmenica TaxID=2530375 RepID=A0A4R4X3L2_9ACTN|nr:hypothetical protein [Kribbella turkmenica]TDD24843.1 hypothetical protein E1218_16000 [Kribbella turkmenica]
MSHHTAPHQPSIPLPPGAPPTTAAAPTAGVRSTPAERRARAEWLAAEFRRRAAGCDNPQEEANLLRSADSLLRLASAYQP